MNNKNKLLTYLSFHEIPNKKQEVILQVLEDFSIENVLCNEAVRRILSAEEIKRLLQNWDARAFESSLQNMQNRQVGLVTIFDDAYPKSLRALPDRPLILYYKGDLSLFEEKCVAIVGTREPTSYGRLVTERFAKNLAESGFVVVSGLCHGVDSIAHRATLEVKGKTIAILGGGFNHIYPVTNISLAREIVESGGLVISEYPPSFVPKKYTFPRRNRIVAGVSDGILITEAGARSGTLHTKEFALEYGKDIFAIPGNITSVKSELPNMMIKKAQAECVTSPEEIISFYGVQVKAKESSFVNLSFDEQTIVNLLQGGEKDFDFLAEKSEISVNLLSSCLTTLEIRGLIRRLPTGEFGLIQ